MIRFCRDKDEAEPIIDISADGEHPFCALSFDHQHGRIPVPGLEGMFSETITGMLEGLRLVSRRGLPGKVDFGYFVGPGRERPVRSGYWATGYSYRGRCVDLVEARRRILIPAYLWVLSHKAGAALSKVRKRAEQHDVWLWDGYPSCDITATDRLSAAATLAAYLSGQLQHFQDGDPIFSQ